ncbi:MAG: hypothetical protein P8Z30_01675 [Acidobacteriota bacterium]
MIAPNLIPAPDPNPLPAPYWVLETLLLVTFFLHILAMNFMLGGAVMALVAKWGPAKRKNGNRMFSDIARKLPVLLPAVITVGIAPLLFVQVLYGQFFYTSSIIMAWPWLFVLVLLAAAYYGFYFVSYKKERYPDRAGLVLLLSVVSIFIIAFLFSNNITLTQTPARWGAKYFADPGGWNLNLSEPTLIPRYLHFMTAAVALGGILLVLLAWARWKQDREYARDVFHLGGKTFMYATMAEFLVGIWFLVALPRQMTYLFLGGDPLATILLGIAVAGAIGAIVVMARALRSENIRLAAYSVMGIMSVVIFSMVGIREILFHAYLKPYFHPEQFAVKTQWSVFPLFLVLFVAGVILWFVMLKRYGLFARRKLPDQPQP